MCNFKLLKITRSYSNFRILRMYCEEVRFYILKVIIKTDLKMIKF